MPVSPARSIIPWIWSRENLCSSRVPNLSSASVLHVLSETTPLARQGDLGVLLAMGPGFCAEMVLLAW